MNTKGTASYEQAAADPAVRDFQLWYERWLRREHPGIKVFIPGEGERMNDIAPPPLPGEIG